MFLTRFIPEPIASLLKPPYSFVYRHLSQLRTRKRLMRDGFRSYIHVYEGDYNTPFHRGYREQEIFRQGERVPLFHREQLLLDRHLIEGEKVLDIGCNRGRLVLRLSQEGYRVTGVDCVAQALRDGINDATSLGLKPNFLLSLAEALPFESGSFDTVIINETLEHVVDPDKILHEVVRVALHTVLVSTPEGNSYDDSLHINHFSRVSFRKLLERYGDVVYLDAVPSAEKDFGTDKRIIVAKIKKGVHQRRES